ncbi:MAG: 50S ribosomal protein L23 [Desulfovibrio sp.]|jgi:large subunit ribosomal protein L23|nr:50S ribosomal protein L23 [Desulfovibrio sp.]
MDYTQVLLKPLISEKATLAKEECNSVAFYVHPSANKIEVKNAVEKAFDVTVEAVNIVNRKSRDRKRFGRLVGRIAGHKKAYVRLAPGSKIDLFEGV